VKCHGLVTGNTNNIFVQNCGGKPLIKWPLEKTKKGVRIMDLGVSDCEDARCVELVLDQRSLFINLLFVDIGDECPMREIVVGTGSESYPVTDFGIICIESSSSASPLVTGVDLLLSEISTEDGRLMELAQDRVLRKVSNVRVLPLVSSLVTGAEAPGIA
jgi:hypothetical protein